MTLNGNVNTDTVSGYSSKSKSYGFYTNSFRFYMSMPVSCSLDYSLYDGGSTLEPPKLIEEPESYSLSCCALTL